MTTTEKIKTITEIVKLHRLGSKTNRAAGQFGLSLESPLIEYQHTLFDKLVGLASAITGINQDSIYWFLYDNDCGSKKFHCISDEKEYPIHNVKDFVLFEELVCKHS